MFVDNIKIIRSKNIKIIARVKIKLTTIFDMIDIGSISFYLGLKVKRNYYKRIIKLL